MAKHEVMELRIDDEAQYLVFRLPTSHIGEVTHALFQILGNYQLDIGDDYIDIILKDDHIARLIVQSNLTDVLITHPWMALVRNDVQMSDDQLDVYHAYLHDMLIHVDQGS